MPIDSDSGGIRDILSDGSPSAGIMAGVEFWPGPKIRGVAWSGRGVSSAKASSQERSYSTTSRVNDCSSIEACLDGKKRDSGGNRGVFRGGDLSERDKEEKDEPENVELIDEFREIGVREGWMYLSGSTAEKST